ncbi:hypothetical protein F6476_13130 [Pseudomonas umsongensis]|uniref:hypothetical protein n=1 Tax=Pseudomonas umsongensis TaxID=198618 RepID=UPI00124705B2|nr:hypothetical protein [Pseudomonas umsongensis]QFG30072.1 hypothetical protein F6476_13130 [Pseudomonas umsongensis]
MADVGEAISEGISFISKVGAECDVLTSLLKQELSVLLSGSLIRGQVRPAGPWVDKFEKDAGGWIQTASAHSLPVIMQRKRSIGAYLFFQISLAGNGIAAQDNTQPLVHVGLWSLPVDFKNYWMGFPLFDLDDVEPELEEGVVFRWPMEGREWGEWTYSLRLAQINTIQDIHEKIVTPVKALLQGKRLPEVFAPNVQGIVRYVAVAEEVGHYRVLQPA